MDFIRKNFRLFVLLLVAVLLAVPVMILVSKDGKKKKPEKEVTEKETETIEESIILPTEYEPPTEEFEEETEYVNPTLEKIPPKSDVLSHYNNIGVVKADHFLNVRETPSTGAKVIGKAWNNSGVDIVEDLLNGWFHIRSGSVDGYVSSEFIATGEEAENLAESNCFLMAKVNAERLNVRDEPSTNGYVWTQLNCDELQSVSEVYEGWLEVMINNSVGYISADYVDFGYYLMDAVRWNPLEDTTETRRRLIEYGMSFLGTPYVYGGLSLTDGIDCSGFTQQLYKEFDCSLHRESYNQKTQGEEVLTIDDAEPGDLLFYTDSEGQVNHVAIYIGSGQILHACESRGGVVITSYNYSTNPSYIKNVLPGR